VPGIINPFDHPLIYAEPQRLTPFSAWHEHIPFAMLLADLARPATLVELGTHAGDSYCAFCQAIKQLDLDTRSFAVDTWAGDEHSSAYGPEILADLRRHHDPLYANFSQLLQTTFDEASEKFAPGSIDLLHIDGFHTYDAVRHDFETWLPRMSSRGIVLFHDTAVTGFGFGVKIFWDEVRMRYPSFEFLHGNGLGVLGVGAEQPETIRRLFSSTSEEVEPTRGLFSALGRRLSLQVEVGRLEGTIREMKQSLGWRILRKLERLNLRLLPKEEKY
jgi:predicted O-methyltransferase YrrM